MDITVPILDFWTPFNSHSFSDLHQKIIFNLNPYPNTEKSEIQTLPTRNYQTVEIQSKVQDSI